MKPRKGRQEAAAQADGASVWLPRVLAAAAAIWILLGLRAPHYQSAFALRDFARLPVLNGGRIKPMDTVARTSLLLLSGKQTLKREQGEREPALEWLLGALFDPSVANAERVFEIDDPDVLGLMGFRQTDRRLYSFNELRPFLAEIETQAGQANDVKGQARSRFQTAVINLENKLQLYQQLQNTLQPAGAVHMADTVNYMDQTLIPAVAGNAGKPSARARAAADEMKQFSDEFQFLAQVAAFFPLPAATAGQPLHWVSIGEAVGRHLEGQDLHPGVPAYAAIGDAYRDSDVAGFAKAVADYRMWLAFHAPGQASWADWEFLFNCADPFFKSALLYVLAFVVLMVSWLAWPRPLGRAAFALAATAFIVHTFGLAARIWIQGRPPVTNLYSSAVFVGWVAVLLALVLERLTKRGISLMVASAIGALTLVVALHLETQGDTMEMMRAVLDSNFWLATHVTCITIGYSSTFLAGFLGAFYLLQRALAPRRFEESASVVENMVYGVVCFSMLFSFFGTILGGIWADQSWGRFWGWDPKENGALMIVLWNAAWLHVRWGKLLDRRGLMTMAVGGNVVTALSWFGVNMLGIGLHSYGFMDKAFNWLMIFIAAQAVVMAVGLLPGRAPARGQRGAA